MEETILKTVKVTKIYNQGKHNEVVPVRDASLAVGRGMAVVLKGPSGSGKTTLLSMIGCQIKPTYGEIVVKGKPVSKLPEKFANLHKRQHIGFVFQQFHLVPDLSVLDNIMLPLLPWGMSPLERRRRAEELLTEFELTPRRQFKVRDLSGGEQQRVAISRSLINGCTVLLADEPTAHLDAQLTADFLGYMNDLKQKGYTILIASHDPVVCENAMVDRIIEMKNGEIVS
ncbi:ABC transporter ATP-binding protein [bacterium]|nr:ABC transporter ATP-binding protein [bacterium]